MSVEEKETKKIEKNEEGKSKLGVFKILYNIIYYLLYFVVFIVIIISLVQRFSDNKKTLGGIRIFNVLTGSMEPNYHVGDILFVKEIKPSQINIGDDISYIGKKTEFDGIVVTHRVKEKEVRKDKIYFVTQGTANPLPDPEISEEQVYGKVIYKSVILSLFSQLMNKTSIFFVIFLAMVFIIAFRLVEKRRSLEESEEE